VFEAYSAWIEYHCHILNCVPNWLCLSLSVGESHNSPHNNFEWNFISVESGALWILWLNERSITLCLLTKSGVCNRILYIGFRFALLGQFSLSIRSFAQFDRWFTQLYESYLRESSGVLPILIANAHFINAVATEPSRRFRYFVAMEPSRIDGSVAAR